MNHYKKKAYTYKSKEEPEDFEAKFKCNIALFDHETIKTLVEECQPHAKASEFQIHYHSLQAHITKGSYEVCVTVPLAFYNFDQEVTSGSVSMEMKDVNEIAVIAEELLDDKVAEVFKLYPIFDHIQHLGFDVNYTVSNNGSIHRHPGDFSFSSVDYDKDPDEPGVIYRQMKAKDLYQTDSVIYLGEEEPKFVCTETRIVNVKPVENDGGIEGKYTEIPTYSFITKPDGVKNLMYEILGGVEDKDIFDSFKCTSSMSSKLVEYPLLVELLKAFKETEYKPDTTNVIGNRITQEYGVGKRGTIGYQATQKKSGTTTYSAPNYCGQDMYGDLDEDDWDYYYPGVVSSQAQEFEDSVDELNTCIIQGKEMVYNEEWASWLPIDTLKMNEAELIQYLDAQGIA